MDVGEVVSRLFNCEEEAEKSEKILLTPHKPIRPVPRSESSLPTDLRSESDRHTEREDK